MPQWPDPPLDTPDILTARPYRDHPYTLQPFPQTSVGFVKAGALIDGVGDLEFRPITLTVQALVGMNTDFTYDTLAAPPLGNGRRGCFVLQVRGHLNNGGYYLRRFALPVWRALSFDISTWRDVSVDVLRSTLAGVTIGATVSNRPTNSVIREVLSYAESYAGPGTYLVPPGAIEVVAGADDAGFLWRTDDDGGATVAIPDPMVAGAVKHDVRGVCFTTTGAWSGVWRIVI